VACDYFNITSMLFASIFFLFNFCDFVIGDKVCVDVYPHLSCGLAYTDETSCENAGCCWDDSPGAINSCFAPKIYGYAYSETSSQPGVVQGSLELTDPSGMLGPDFTELDITITQETASRTHIKIVPPNSNRWEVPETLLPRPGGVYTEADALTSTIISTAKTDPNNPMEIYISRQNGGVPTGELIFIFSKMLVYQDQYIQCVLASPTGVVASYGFGESTRTSQHLEVNSTYAMWNTDHLAASFDGSLYGTHPFFIQVMPSGKAHGVMFMNSNAQQAFIADSDTMGQSIGVQTTGGVLDMYVFAGPTPADVVKQLQEVVGKPAMVPMWALGFHVSASLMTSIRNLTLISKIISHYCIIS
jgi:alpha-glucosidase